jgi:hypothetical protein
VDAVGVTDTVTGNTVVSPLPPPPPQPAMTIVNTMAGHARAKNVESFTAAPPHGLPQTWTAVHGALTGNDSQPLLDLLRNQKPRGP